MVGVEGYGDKEYLFAGTFMRMRVLAAPRLQQLFSWMLRQHTAEPKQSLPVGRQMSAARAVPKEAESAARMVRNCIFARRWSEDVMVG
jgi:hypothetical protein